MDIPRESSRPGGGEQVARAAVAVFLLLSMLTLAFGLGYAVHDLTTDTPASRPAAEQAGAGGDDAIGAAIIDEIVELLKTRYVDKSAIDPETLREAAIDGIIRSLNDSHTEYLTPAEMAAGALNLSSSYDGIGATVSDRGGVITIVAPFRDSPAEKAGIRAGDIILEVDGVSTEGWTQTQAVQVIRGPSGTQVTLKVKHTDGTIETITITRGNIPLESVFLEPNLEVIPGESGSKLVDRNGNEVTDIAYVAITQFHDRTLNELRTKLKDVEAKGYKGLIVDLRGNPGGLLQATVDVADEFLDSGIILSEVDADGKIESWNARRGGILTRIPIVILQDQGSASGAEVLAAALRDNGRARIVGTRSFGKGTVNQLQELKSCGDPKGCGALYISVGRWLTPKGDQIEGLGVKPDIEVPMSYDDYVDRGDIQLFKAIDLLRGN
ncbi:S41 family peptidase [Tepidiforma thermophila]|uniref:Carboxyl-terminal processing protease n=1 Tax=Tepidiforma thermophila (strain KCTC 52669 / CGMCC 1.13589 / G233) TaxID=2761530 RepID=A0A2A9HH08_TEPT2|nr:S41 family peptidase [Tepidiforma thermophila]PFG74643.1 carboxyl-terminal processing protease [Tepidiforma thermophila]